MRRFNVTGLCVPTKHYMADIGGKIEKIRKLVDDGSYFAINRARQYGKTTTLNELEKRLAGDYICANISFEGIGDDDFQSAAAFCAMLLQEISRALSLLPGLESYANEWLNDEILDFRPLSRHISKMCKDKKIVLMIDEVDKSTNNRVFLHFLGMLREKYLSAQAGKDSTFHSVILTGVTDVKNLKLKMINDGIYTPSQTEGQLHNSPWNIAVSFNVDMAFTPEEIASMLSDYENDYQTGMDIHAVSEEIFRYTDGYPFLVSRICQSIDEELDKAWSGNGIQKALNIILQEENVLFDDLAKNLENNRALYDLLYVLLIVGERRSFVTDNPVIKMGSMFGYIKKGDEMPDGGLSGYAVIANKIFEMRMSYYFISKDENASRMDNAVSRPLYHDIVEKGSFDMELCLRKFAEHYKELFSEKDTPFLERHGRLLFLSYLKPLVNGRGFYHIESQFTDLRRMDVVIDYGRDQFIVELKIWRGEIAQDKAYSQLLDYMDSKNADKGYLLIFDFRQGADKEPKSEWIRTGDGRSIFEVII